MQSSATILLIEDEPDLRETSAAVLEALGYCVLQARSWEHAVSLGEQHRGKVGLVVTDLVMPGRAGVDVFRRVRAQHGAVPVIVVSGYPKVMRLLDGVLEGVTDWLQKPVEVQELGRAVERALERRSAS